MAIVLDGTSGITAPAATIAGTVSGSPVQGGLVSGTAVASTSGTSIDFTGIPSWAKRITVMFSGVSTNGTSAIQVRLGDSGGFETTGYASTSGSINSAGMGSAAAATSGFTLRDTSSAAFVYNGQLLISNLSGNIFTCSGLFSADSSGAGSIVMGSKTLSDTLTQVQIRTANGTDTFDAGTINIMYEG